MKTKVLCGVVMGVFLLTGLAAYAETMKDIQTHPTCKYCEMDRQKYAHSRGLIEYEDGSSFGSCSLYCTAIDLVQSFDKQPKAIFAADYNKKNLIDAEKAYWVIGGDKPGTMTKTAKWAFADKKDADTFIKEHGGKLGTFDEAMKTTYEDMYKDTKMIREKRAKMKKMEEKKTQ
jgi:copper chaperone NosL